MGPLYSRRLPKRPLPRRLSACSLAGLLCVPCGGAAWAQVAGPELPGTQPVLYAPSPSVQTEGTTAAAGAETLPEAPGFQQAAATERPATIHGTIYDVNGGIVPGATITVLDKAGKTISTVETGSDATFELADIAPGTYRVKVTAAGLEGFESPEITLKAGERYELPETALPIATANQTVNVVLTQSMIADLEIREETKQRVLGVFPSFYTSYQWNAAPMNTRQKFYLSFRSTTDPVAFATAAVVAGIEQLNNTYPGYGPGPEGYGKRYGAAFGDATIGRFIGYAILPSVFHQDPRYFYMGPPATTKQRLYHALAFSVTARSDRGHDGHLMPNYSHILGNFIAGYISKTYHPDENSGLGLATANALIGIGGSAVQGLLREFVFGHITAHLPDHPLGKPKNEPTDEQKAPVATPPAPAASPTPAT